MPASIQTSPDGCLRRHLSFVAAIALSFGYAVGWGAFMMPGRAFLPGAGPLGTTVGILLGAVAITVFALNYHRLMVRHPGPGGAFTFAQKAFGEDHAFLVGWFLWLTYIAILWANATAVILIARMTFGDSFQFGFHYTVVGFDVYLGEALLAMATIAFCGAICLYRNVLAAWVQTLFASVLAGGILLFFLAALFRHSGGVEAMAPAFNDDVHPVLQVLRILAMIPWAYVGFEAISNLSCEFRFPLRRSLGVLVAAVVVSTLAYLFLALLPVLSLPDGAASWKVYLGDSTVLDSIERVPVFASARRLFGGAGVALMSTMMMAGQVTGIIAALVALSRLMRAMSEAGVLPRRLGAVSPDGTPRNAMLFVMGVSAAIPFFGRTAIGWPVDVSSIGAAVAYAYTSAAALRTYGRAGGRGGRRFLAARAAGFAGVVMAAFFCLLLLIPNYISGSVLAAPSYLVLAIWCVLGFVYYRGVFKEGHKRRFGRSVVVWVSLFVTIIFASLMWVRQSTFEAAKDALTESVKCCAPCETIHLGHVAKKISRLNKSMLFSAGVEMALLVMALATMLSLVSILRRREKVLVAEKTKAEDMTKAKTYFFSTVSHDIRTPLNAIIGFSEMLKDGFKTKAEHDQAVDSILVSGKTLLKLINDVLDLSKLESGRMEIMPEPTDCRRLLGEIAESFSISHKSSDLEIRADVSEMPTLMLDPQRIRQIAFNLMGNATKFTKKGFVEVRAGFTPDGDGRTGVFQLAVEDSGCGISEEDIKRIATPYVQVGAKESRHGGTGLGLAITRQLATAMGGEMTIKSELGRGTTFFVTVPGVKVAEGGGEPAQAAAAPGGEPSAARGKAVSARRILIVDDQKMNLMVLKAMLSKIGKFDLVMAQNGREAMDILLDEGVPEFDLALTDMWMPEMDGETLVREIRRHPRVAKLPVYVITADVETRKNYAQLGFNGILLKPVTLDGLESLFK